MPSIINSDDGVISGSSGLETTGGNDGITVFQQNGVERFRIGTAGQLGVGGANYGTSGQVLTSQGASSAPVWSSANGMTLLGTLTTTSGGTQTLSGLDLSGYKNVVLFLNNVSHNNATTAQSLRLASIIMVDNTIGNTGSLWGCMTIDLQTGACGISASTATSATGTAAVGTSRGGGGNVGITTASTSLSFTWSAGASFDAGSINIYGVR
jgi:hypothetical protein